MSKFTALKFNVTSPAQLRAVVAKLVEQGYGIGCSRTARVTNAEHDYVLTFDDGMILFGSNRKPWGVAKKTFDGVDFVETDADQFIFSGDNRETL